MALRRLGEMVQLLWRMISWAILLLLWVSVFSVFWIKIVPRLTYIFASRAIANDPPCITPECDFSAFWPAGLLAREHDFARIYDSVAFLAFQRHVLAPSANLNAFFYPPTMLLPSMLISHLPFEPAFFVWVIAGAGIAATLLRWAGYSWLVIAAGLLSPAALWNMELGQLGVVGGGLLLAGVMLSVRHKLPSGGLLGLLAFKPQIGVLVPFALLAQGNWRALVGFSTVCAVLLILTLICLGPSSWAAYHALGSTHMLAVLNTPFDAHAYEGEGISVFWMVRSFGAGLSMAYVVQAVCGILAVLGVVYAWRRPSLTRETQMTLTIFLSLLATPYGYGDDMVAWSWVLAARAERRDWRIGLLDALFWIWPMLCEVVAYRTGHLFTPLIVLLAVARAVYESGNRRGADIIAAR